MVAKCLFRRQKTWDNMVNGPWFPPILRRAAGRVLNSSPLTTLRTAHNSVAVEASATFPAKHAKSSNQNSIKPYDIN